MQDSNKEEIVDDAPVASGVAMQSPWQASITPPQPSPRPRHLTAYSTGLPEDGLANYNSGNYGQLYRRVSHLRQNQRPYAEFQQHVVQPRVGAGGFRIPVTDETLPPYEEECRRLNSGELGLAGGEMDKGEVGSGSRYGGKRCCLAPVPGAAAPVGVVIVVKRNTLENCYKVKREREKR
ncbi:hypothetical protein NQZ79_g6345 [Umbelopsis isabellina]|nr:hypothetical protein NQZ79_g6345 [Umbelopsis isabellina]